MLHHLYRYTIAFLTGAVALVILSFIQKIFAGFNPYILKAYIVPFLFGGTVGIIIGLYLLKVQDLNAKLLQRVDVLEHLLPICSYCKKIRKPHTDPLQTNSWESIESYISKKTSSKFSHGICPDCRDELYELMKKPN